MTTLLVLALLGLLLGFGAERLIGRRRRSPLRVFGLLVLIFLLLVVAAGVGGWFWANSVFDRVERVDVGDSLGHGRSGTNYLLVGADNGPDSEGREGIEGVRSDTIMILNIRGGRSRMLSLNRDLWVRNPATSEMGRINASYNAGPENLIRTIDENFGIPIDRYIEIDFTSFAGLVDALGGIEIDFPHPAFDHASGLHVPQTGLVRLDGDQALAYVRSRHYTEVIDGREVEDLSSDLGRVLRQQRFLRAVMAEQGATRNPFELMKVASTMSDGLRIDHEMTLVDAVRFTWRMGHLDPETVELPVVPRRTTGGAAVLELGDGADDVLATFR